MTHEDFEFYSLQCDKMESRFKAIMSKMGLKVGDFFDQVKEDLDMSLPWYWQFLCGFENDIREALMAPKRTNRKLLLENRAEARIGRITREYRKLASYIAGL